MSPPAKTSSPAFMNWGGKGEEEGGEEEEGEEEEMEEVR